MPEIRLRFALLAALVVGAMLGGGAMAVREDGARRALRATADEASALNALDALAAHARYDVASLRLAPLEPAAAEPADPQQDAVLFRRALDDVQMRAPSALEPSLRRLYRNHERLAAMARATAAGASAGMAAGSLATVEREQDEDFSALHRAFARNLDGAMQPDVTPPFVRLLLASVGAALLVSLYALVGVVARSLRRSMHAAADPDASACAGLDDALPHLADWVFTCTLDGRIEQVLAASHRHAGLDRRSLLGRTLWHLTPSLHPDALQTLVPERDSIVLLTSLGLHPDDSVPVRLVLTRPGGKDARKLLAIARDRRDEVEIEQSFHERTTQLLNARANLEHLREKVLYVAEEEQERIGRELHDGVGQQLAGIAFLTHALADRSRDGEAATDLRWLSELAGRAAESVRGISRQLGTSQFDRGNVATLLSQLCEDTANAFDVDCRWLPGDAQADLPQLAPDAMRHVYRIAQESLNNALRHGQAKRILMRLDTRRRRIRLAIMDDGIGFNLLQHAGIWRRGLGLHSMRMRAALIGGNLRIRSGAHGTLVMLAAPCAMPNTA